MNIVGTEERDFDKFSRFTVYIIQIKFGQHAIKIFKRYNSFRELRKLLVKEFPAFKFSDLPRRRWFTTLKTKTIEERKFSVANFLQKALLNPEIRFSKVLLDFLILPRAFFECSRG